jgi:hypothetical protein
MRDKLEVKDVVARIIVSCSYEAFSGVGAVKGSEGVGADNERCIGACNNVREGGKSD